MANTDPPPTWPIEVTNWFIVLYYENNEPNTPPSTTSTLMRDYNAALELAKQTILDNGNAGVCAISQVTGTIVYPSVPWEDF